MRRYYHLFALTLPGNSSSFVASITIHERKVSNNSRFYRKVPLQSTNTQLGLVCIGKESTSCQRTGTHRTLSNSIPAFCSNQRCRWWARSPAIYLSNRGDEIANTRGGGTNNPKSLPTGNRKITPKLKIVSLVTLAITLTSIGIHNREVIASFEFKKWLSSQLDALASLGTAGLIFYSFFFMLWEMTLGITTPVETAAGMAFGLKKGILANAVGKTSGALLAFLLGRSVLYNYASKKLEGNEYMDLVRDSITRNPIRVALIWRFSFLPEFVKNFGLAMLPVKTWQFATAVLMHGFPFTMLWTFMGNEMGEVVRGISEPSRILKMLVGLVYVFGFFISPTLVGLWVKSLRDEKMQRLDGIKEK